MRVLVFLPCFTHGGAEKQGAILARHLIQKGYDVQVWGFPTLGASAPLLEELKNEGIRCLELPEWPRFDWDFTRRGRYLRYIEQRFYEWPKQVNRFRKTLPSVSVDVVIPFTPMPCVVSVLLAEQIRARRIVWNHRGGYDDAGFKYNKFLVRHVMEHHPTMVANSSAGAQFLTDKFSLSPNEVSVIHNMFLPDIELSNLASQREYRDKKGLSLQLLHVANLFAEKDIWTVLDSITHLKASGFDCHLHIAGFFPNSQDQNKFENMVRENNIASMITFHGAVNKQQLYTLLSIADIGLLSSRSEGLSNSIMEYMYSGLPVIGTDIPGIRELLGCEGTSWLFPYGNADHLSSLLIRLGLDKAARQKLGEANRRRILEDFSTEKLMFKWEKVLEH